MNYKVKNVLLCGYYTLLNTNETIKYFLRKTGMNKRYEYLKKYKDIHKGENCVIIGNGPSLRVEDLSNLRDVCSFGVNGIVSIFDKTEWRPDYYGIQDKMAFDLYNKYIELSELGDVFVGEDLYNKEKSFFKEANPYPWNQYYHNYKAYVKNQYFSKVSENITLVVYDGFSIIYSMIQIAVYMGFTKIYLYGCDCNYKQGKEGNYFTGAKNVSFISDAQMGLRMINAYENIREYLAEHRPDIQIYNATRGGMLEVFERRSIEELF